MGKKISFVSSKNRGITLDMLVVKDFFRVMMRKLNLRMWLQMKMQKIPL